jgi:hypothetical protein
LSLPTSGVFTLSSDNANWNGWTGLFGSPYDTDAAGNAFTTDRGAFQFSSGILAVATPSISPASGSYSSTQTVSIADSTAGATICYTTDGSTPTTNGAGTCTHGSTYSGTFSQAMSATVKAVGSLSGETDSSVGSNSYTFVLSFGAPTNLHVVSIN